MEKTAMAQLREKLQYVAISNDTPKEYALAVINVIKDIDAQMAEIEKEQLCKMYVQGRKDNHLDYYPEKHAKETYDEFFVRGEQNEC
jgi:uncharacterized phage protein gp47/JayE